MQRFIGIQNNPGNSYENEYALDNQPMRNPHNK